MEANETRMNSYYYESQSQAQQEESPQPTNGTITTTTTNTTPPPNCVENSNKSNSGGKKRGRPRKYNTPEEAAAARRAQLAHPKKPKEPPLAGPPPSITHHKGNVGQGFTPHIISVAAGEDVYQRIMLFMQQSKREICILSASGSISSPFLRQPATSGGNITYEGRFDILSLSGSYIRTDLGGRTGGLSVCMSSVDGQIIGGGVGGPLRAAGPVEVIVGTFLVEAKKELFSPTKGMEQMEW